MKKLSAFALIFAAFLFYGCSFKDGGIDLGTPKSVYMGGKTDAKAHFGGVTDARNDKNIGVIRDKDGGIAASITAVTDVAAWSATAFEKEMGAAGFVFAPKEGNTVRSYSFTLTRVGAEYFKGELTGKNLKLKMDISVKITGTNGVVITKNYKYDEQKWVKPIFDSEGIKKELLPFMQESVAATVKDLAALSTVR